MWKACENLTKGCVWFGNYIHWKLQWDADQLYKNLLNEKISKDKISNMQRVYQFTIDEYKVYIRSITSNFIETSKITPKDINAIFDSLSTQNYRRARKWVTFFLSKV